MVRIHKSKDKLQAEILLSVSHPNRIRIIKALSEKPLCNCELMPLLGLEQSNLSRHLKNLERSGILVSWKEGLRVNYKIADIRVFEILEIAEKIALENL